MLLGIDIASHQGRYDFALARRQGRSFAIIKVSGGHGYQNEERDQQITRAREAGLLVGAYHYMGEPSHPDGGGDPRREFANFHAAVGPYVQPGLTIWLDVEEWPANFGYTGNIGDFIDTFATLVEQTYGCRCGIYTGTYYLVGTGLLHDQRLARCPLWIASWQDVVPGVAYLAPWTTATMWQNDAYTVVAGQQTDTDVFFGTAEDFQALGVPYDATTVSSTIALGHGVARDDGAMSPIKVTFQNPNEGGFGIPYKIGVWVWNPDEGKHYYDEWELGQYKPWLLLG